MLMCFYTQAVGWNSVFWFSSRISAVDKAKPIVALWVSLQLCILLANLHIARARVDLRTSEQRNALKVNGEMGTEVGQRGGMGGATCDLLIATFFSFFFANGCCVVCDLWLGDLRLVTWFAGILRKVPRFFGIVTSDSRLANLELRVEICDLRLDFWLQICDLKTGHCDRRSMALDFQLLTCELPYYPQLATYDCKWQLLPYDFQ